MQRCLGAGVAGSAAWGDREDVCGRGRTGVVFVPCQPLPEPRVPGRGGEALQMSLLVALREPPCVAASPPTAICISIWHRVAPTATPPAQQSLMFSSKPRNSFTRSLELHPTSKEVGLCCLETSEDAGLRHGARCGLENERRNGGSKGRSRPGAVAGRVVSTHWHRQLLAGSSVSDPEDAAPPRARTSLRRDRRPDA